MEQTAISKFEATCLALLDLMKTSGEPLRVHKAGRARCHHDNAASTSPQSKSAFGCMKETVVIKGDIISPVGEDGWEALNS